MTDLSNFATATRQSATPGLSDEVAENVVQRLRRRVREAKKLGFRVRSENLEEEQATWCEIGGVKTIFIDLSQTAAEQLHQLNEALESFAPSGREDAPGTIAAAPQPATQRQETGRAA